MSKALLLLLLLNTLYSLGQDNYELIFSNESYKQLVKRPKTTFKDSLSVVDFTRKLQSNAINSGYILASIDQLEFSGKQASLNFNLGDKFSSCILTIDPVELLFLKRNSRVNEKLISRVAFTPNELNKTLSSTLNTYLNQGYPFASVKLKNPLIERHQLTSEINIIRGPYYTWSAINVRGDSAISTKYISNLLDIKVGEPYTEYSLNEVSKRIEQVPFLNETKPPELLFTKQGVELFLYLESIPISSFNGVVGFQPNPNSTKGVFTGALNLTLHDVLHRGELLTIKWQSIQVQTQALDAHLNYPFLFNTSFGIDGTFNLYKRDTSFLELKSTIGIQYFLRHGNYIKAYYQNMKSNALSGGENNPSFSKLGNVQSNSYGIAYLFKNTDYAPNPSRGIDLLFESNVGTRKVQTIDTVSEIKSALYQMKLKVDCFIPLHKRHVLRLANLTEFYASDEIFENEVYRYGGLTNQRGFNEDELYATTKTTATLEYRFLLDKNSHVFAFYDQSWYENNSSSYYNDTPFGFGLGLAFRTNFGIFSISYALGKQRNNPILFSNSKVHFGYNVYF